MSVTLVPRCIDRLGGVPLGTPISLVDFSRLLGDLVGRPRRVTALEQLCAGDSELEGRLTKRILPAIVRLARQLPDAPLDSHVPLGAVRTSLPRRLVAGWLAHLFLGTIAEPSPEHPELCGARLLASQHPWEQAKVRCVVEYFDRVAQAAPQGTLEIERVVAPAPTLEHWAANTMPLADLDVEPAGAIEDAAGHRQVDFANQYLGGGVLSGGCVQEEIRFAVAPENLFGMLLSPRMRPEEAIVLRGAERFALTRGYGRSLAFDGPFEDPTPRLADGTPDIELAAIDAVDYRGKDPSAQYSLEAIHRELGKARSGFLRDQRLLPIASGNWGCGAFGGDPQLKAVIQWLAASAEGRRLRYFTFGDLRVGDLAGFVAAARAQHASVGALARRLLAVAPSGGGDLYRRVLARVSFSE